jgi:glycosyltransferase involved in cell wall biosynthesis
MQNKGGARQRVSAIICTRNEAGNLPLVLPGVQNGVDEILLVDAHSQDGTEEVARKLCPHIRIVYQPGKGKGDALRYGFEQATGDIIVTLDADGSMDPKEISSFVTPLMDGYDFVKGSRFLKGGGTADMPRHRIIGNRFFVILTNMLYSTGYTDLAYGYNAVKKSALKAITLTSDGFEIETELNIKAAKAGLKIKEVPSVEAKRLSGKGGLRSLPDGWRILRTIFRERFRD